MNNLKICADTANKKFTITITRDRFNTGIQPNITMTGEELLHLCTTFQPFDKDKAPLILPGECDYERGRKQRTGEPDRIGGTHSLMVLDADKLAADVNGWFLDQLSWAAEFNDFGMLVYNSASDRPDSHRYRIVIPLSRPVTDEDYRAITTAIIIIIGPVALQPPELKDSWPIDECSVAANHLFVLPVAPPSNPDYKPFVDVMNEWKVLDVDHILELIRSRDDLTTLPYRAKTHAPTTTNSERHYRAGGTYDGMRDPTEIPGVIGEFCRRYTVEDVLNEFLGDYYEQCGEKWRPVTSSSPAGAVVFQNEQWFFSNHTDSDPIAQYFGSPHPVHAYDLMRVCLYGDLDDLEDKSDPARSPSGRAMYEWCREHDLVPAKKSSGHSYRITPVQIKHEPEPESTVPDPDEPFPETQPLKTAPTPAPVEHTSTPVTVVIAADHTFTSNRGTIEITVADRPTCTGDRDVHVEIQRKDGRQWDVIESYDMGCGDRETLHDIASWYWIYVRRPELRGEEWTTQYHSGAPINAGYAIRYSVTYDDHRHEDERIVVSPIGWDIPEAERPAEKKPRRSHAEVEAEREAIKAERHREYMLRRYGVEEKPVADAPKAKAPKPATPELEFDDSGINWNYHSGNDDDDGEGPF